MKHFVMTAVTPLAVPGDSAGTTCRDGGLFSAELACPLNKALSVGLDYGYRQRLPKSQDAAGEAAAHFNYRFSHGRKLHSCTQSQATPSRAPTGEAARASRTRSKVGHEQ